MGGWKNRRRIPRRKFDPNRYLYNDSASDRHDDAADNVPSWEKEFCKVIGSVPWGKVVFSKTLLDYHDNILNWDDSAGEEAFQNAKNRFWAEINDLNCGIPLPDPDLHIDRVNWNQVIDAELVKELDREYYNPDEMKDEAGTRSEDTVNDDPWESDRKQHNGSLKIQDWRSTVHKNDCNDIGRGSPWKRSIDKHNEWGDGAKLSSWSHWGDQPNKDSDAYPQERRFQNVRFQNDEGWGNYEHTSPSHNYTKRKDSDACPQERRFQNARFQNDEGWGNYEHTSPSQNYTKRLQLDRDVNAWCHGQIQEKRGLHDNRRSRGCDDNLYVRERWDNTRIRPNVDRSLPPRNDDYRRRGSSYTYIPRYKRTRFQGENYPS